MAEDDLIYIDVSPALAFNMAVLSGASAALDALKKEQAAGKNAPGFLMALWRVEALVADLRANQAGDALRAVAKAGFDISKHAEVYSGFKGGKAYLALSPADLLSGIEP